MSLAPEPESGVPPLPEAAVGLWARVLLVFGRPGQAWEGLRARVQWWFPMLLVAVVTTAAMLAVYDRSYLPMMTEGIERQVADGQMSAQQLEHAQAFFSGPAGRTLNACFQFLGIAIMTFITALAVWLGGGFILGRPFGYRLALEVAAWSSLITLPGFLLTSLIAYLQGVTVRDVHVGFGILVGEPETPSRAIVALRAFLDGIGPLSIWYVVVAALGLSALSGAPRKAAGWVMGSLYLALLVLGAGIAGLGTRGG